VLRQLRYAVISLIVLTVLAGVVYPLAVTGVAQSLFRHKSNGSIISENGTDIGSELIGQPFSDPRYFWGRLSATTYDAAASSGSNYGPSNPALQEAIQARIEALKEVEDNVGLNDNQTIPVDLVTFSASGLDPDISVAAARYQVPRVARYRSMSEDTISSLVDLYTEGRQLGILGEPRVNVLKLNLALDQLQ
jgi:potassium-transporting ATPase KdpC subunit